MTKLTFTCPKCGSSILSSELRVDWGSSGAANCPVCNASVRCSPAYPLIVLWGSFPVLCFLLVRTGIRNGLVSPFRMIVIWFVGSLLVSLLISQIWPPKLKLTRRHDKDAPIELFDKRR